MVVRSMAAIAGLALAGCTTAGELPPPAATPAATIATPTPAEANAAFEKLGAAYIDIVTAMDPVSATQVGDHEHDGELPAIDAAARTRRMMMDRERLQALAAIDPALLTRDNQVDYALLKNAVEYDLWDVETLQTWAWNPQYYNDIASYALYSLVARTSRPGRSVSGISSNGWRSCRRSSPKRGISAIRRGWRHHPG